MFKRNFHILKFKYQKKLTNYNKKMKSFKMWTISWKLQWEEEISFDYTKEKLQSL